MKLMSFAYTEYAGKRKLTRRERFLIESHYPKSEGGRTAHPLMAILRGQLMQN